MRLFGWFRRQTLIVMRTEDMVLVHPETDFSYRCSACASEVGIYPSGQALIRQLGTKRLRIVCNHCVDAGKVSRAQLAPGAMAEVGQSVRREP